MLATPWAPQMRRLSRSSRKPIQKVGLGTCESQHPIASLHVHEHLHMKFTLAPTSSHNHAYIFMGVAHDHEHQICRLEIPLEHQPCQKKCRILIFGLANYVTSSLVHYFTKKMMTCTQTIVSMRLPVPQCCRIARPNPSEMVDHDAGKYP